MQLLVLDGLFLHADPRGPVAGRADDHHVGDRHGRGSFSLGIREQIIFPEINYDDVDTIRGLDVAITTSAADNEQAEALLRGLGMPFPGMAEPAPEGEEE